jgi:hypothetical protein
VPEAEGATGRARKPCDWLLTVADVLDKLLDLCVRHRCNTSIASNVVPMCPESRPITTMPEPANGAWNDSMGRASKSDLDALATAYALRMFQAIDEAMRRHPDTPPRPSTFVHGRPRL